MHPASKANTLRYLQKSVIGLAILLLLFGATAEFLAHHHDTEFSERVCQLCHPTVLGVQQATLQLPTPTNISWTIDLSDYASPHAPATRSSSSRAPPTA